VHDGPPPFGAEWEEIVEASFAPTTSEVGLFEWGGGGEGPYPLGLTLGDWRARYCATGMDAARHAGPPAEGTDSVDRYLLQLWPAQPALDRVVRETSATAVFWHDHARRTTPPPPPPTPEELAEAERQEQRSRRAAQERFEVQEYWGGRPPSESLRRLGGLPPELARRDRDLFDQLDQAGDVVQRQVAVWTARRACEVAGLASTDWVARALDALDGGEPLPEPFDDMTAVFGRLHGRPGRGVGRATGSLVAASGGERAARPRVDPRSAALPAIPAAARSDPLRAAIDALAAAARAFGDAQVLVDEVRSRFPALSSR
jgi:hypothetical protein